MIVASSCCGDRRPTWPAIRAWGRAKRYTERIRFLTARWLLRLFAGLQGDDPRYWQAAALLKHFLANSNEDVPHKSHSSNFDERLFWEYYSVPFRMAFQDARCTCVDGLVQRVERYSDGDQPRSEERCHQPMACRYRLKRWRRGYRSCDAAPSFSQSAASGGGVSESGY